MEVRIFDNHLKLSEAWSEEIVTLLQTKPAAGICLASGDTPKPGCGILTRKLLTGNIDLRQFHFYGLDEWVGVHPENAGSCRYFFRHFLLEPLGCRDDQVHLFDAMSPRLEEECKRMDAAIVSNGGIDIAVVGIGINGHLGLNEPGISFGLYSHVAELAESTRSVGQKYFEQSQPLEKGITLGLRHLMEAGTLILIANGDKKAQVIKEALEGEITNQLPASIIQSHHNAIVMLDRPAASLLRDQ